MRDHTFQDTRILLHRLLNDHTCGWSMGAPGAIAEFIRDRTETVKLDITDRGGGAVTLRGGIAVNLPEDTLPLAFEILSGCGTGWTQGVAFCLKAPRTLLRKLRRRGVREIGPDNGALRHRDREAVLFDLGVGAAHGDFCVRSEDQELVTALRASGRQGFLKPGNPAALAVLAKSPNRVVISRLGRLEVYQAIPPAEAGSRSPLGPHTHLLPKILARGDSYPAAIPVPKGYVPHLTAYPEHPLSDYEGRPKSFDRRAFEAFQSLLRRFGAPEYVAAKGLVARAIRENAAPEVLVSRDDPLKRLAFKVVLAQWAGDHEPGDYPSKWRQLLEGIGTPSGHH